MPLRWILVVMFCQAGLAFAQSTTQPAGRMAADAARAQQIRRWLGELADPQASVRDRAREELMGLKVKELTLLRAAIQEAKTLEPSQTAALREIVTQVYLASQSYERSDKGFVGVVMSRISGREPGMDVVIESRLPGFSGYRWLRDGDAILDIQERPMPQPMGQLAFTNAISALKPGTVVHLKVLRQGKEIRVPVRLDARPAMKLDEDAEDYQLRIEEMVEERGAEAETYWRENFASLVDTSAKGQ
ncbi:MAG TPA: hypothetical protein VHP11_04180 [Tepidisphaeraceae bacterium]|nr:hypothetical protein [Tepidisphaeraceae bacterium]